MIVVTSANGAIGIREAMRVLKAGGPAVEAVEAGIRLVEANPDDYSVGPGGYPNLLGQVELDASIMDGTSLSAGAVGALQDFDHPISVARRVMEVLPHVMLAGEGAGRFAEEMGFPRHPYISEHARETRERFLRRLMPAEVFEHLPKQKDLWQWVLKATDPAQTYGTVNFIVQDSQGNLCSGVSTSGWAWKYPGRLGDSPIIGAGNYADSRYGAAACTGMGEMAIRAGTARSVVLYLKLGYTLEESGRLAMDDLHDLGGFLDEINILALDRQGHPGAFSDDPQATYLYMTEAMDDPVEQPRTCVPKLKTH